MTRRPTEAQRNWNEDNFAPIPRSNPECDSCGSTETAHVSGHMWRCSECRRMFVGRPCLLGDPSYSGPREIPAPAPLRQHWRDAIRPRVKSWGPSLPRGPLPDASLRLKTTRPPVRLAPPSPSAPRQRPPRDRPEAHRRPGAVGKGKAQVLIRANVTAMKPGNSYAIKATEDVSAVSITRSARILLARQGLDCRCRIGDDIAILRVSKKLNNEEVK